jgi:preprotein translocase subunit SecF
MFDFVKYRYYFLAFSFSLLAAFVALFVYKYYTTGKTFNYSIEFEGGTQFLLKFDAPVKSSEVISTFEKNGFHAVTVREFQGNELVVRVKDVVKDTQAAGEKVVGFIKAQMPSNNVKILQTDAIGAGIGNEMRTKSTKAVTISLILMLLYIAFRFWSFGFAFGAVAALAHDAIIILGFFLLFNMEMSINVIAAILTILGYSVNDTIVIFARIRDNIKAMSGAPIEEIVNVSVNQTLTRTLLTSFATLLTVLSLLIFGGESLRDMSYALIIGIVFGTYSSIYMASPIMMWFHKEKKTA